MPLAVSDGIFLVRGVLSHCLYDLASPRLIHINQYTLGFINETLRCQRSPLSGSEEEVLLGTLLDLGILRESETPCLLPLLDELTPGPVHIDFAWIEVTTRCNLKCVHCYNKASPRGNTDMTYPSFLRALSELCAYGVRDIQFIGGEPLLLGGKLKRMLSEARTSNCKVEIFTNGTLVDRKWIRFFIETNVSVALSAYSSLPKEHDKATRRSGSHALTRRAFESMLREGVTVRTATVRLAGVDPGDVTEMFNTCSEDFPRLCGRAKLCLYDGDMLRRKCLSKSSFTPQLSSEAVKRNLVYHNCFSRRVCVATNLNVYPCVMDRRLQHGNIAQTSLKDVIDSSIVRLTKDRISTCRDCEFRYACFDCRPDSVCIDPFEKPWHCLYDPHSGVWRKLPQIMKLMEVSNGKESRKEI